MGFQSLLRYKGYSITKSLFIEKSPINIPVFDIENFEDNITFNNSPLTDPKRLGKLVESFVFYDLKRMQKVNLICENLQIQDHNLTIGEIDGLFYYNDKPIHLEIVYKFYLYDTLHTYKNSLKYWIGPNRNDTLCKKLKKLEQKQFPLLFNSKTKPYLNKLNLDVTSIQQKLCFKAQLFLPYKVLKINFDTVNSACVSGFYLSFNKIELLNDYLFFIPQKMDWLIEPHDKVDWLNYTEAKENIEEFIIEKRSPMCWVKNKNSVVEKCFITWW